MVLLTGPVPEATTLEPIRSSTRTVAPSGYVDDEPMQAATFWTCGEVDAPLPDTTAPTARTSPAPIWIVGTSTCRQW